jgi:uncharacterized protein affecting Mg2+/Co2+ transport
MYRAVTRGIQVTVTPSFLPDRSSPEEARYFWAYRIEIVNLGKVTVQLKTTGESPTRSGGCRRCAAPASSASSRC